MVYSKGEKIIVAVVIVLVLCQFVLLGINSNSVKQNSSDITHIGFDGKYKTQDGAWKTWDDNKEVNTEKYQQINLKGNLVGDIKQNQRLFFYIQYLEVHIKINGEEIYSYAEEGTYPKNYQSGGERWDSIELEGIDAKDEVEISLISKYKYNYLYAYNKFMDSLSMGETQVLLIDQITGNIANFVGGIILFIIGIFILAAVGILRSINKMRNIPNTILGVHLLVAGVAIFANGSYLTLIYPNPFVIMNISILSYLIILALLLAYLVYYVIEKHRIVLRIEIIICAIMIALVIILQFTGVVDNLGIGLMVMYPMFILEFVAVAIVINSLIKVKNKDNNLILVSVIIYSTFMAIEIVNYFFDWWLFPNSMFIGLFIFLIIQGWISVHETMNIIRNSQKVAAYEKEITESRIAIMLSQIQPHFLYNALNSINYLCKTDPEQAATAIEKFSKYLRVNLDSLRENRLIPLADEIYHVENYVSIEKLRFDNIDMVIDLKVSDLVVPALSLQPIVENAIKHGLAMKDDGGTVTIRTGEDGDFYTVTVSDDGVGFDTNIEIDDKSHIGISNTKKRIEEMSGGTLEVKSVINEGTDVIIKLPRNQVKHKDLE